jgi:elongation factor 1-gamma
LSRAVSFLRMALKLYFNEENKTRAYPALIAAKFNGVSIETPEVKLGDEKSKQKLPLLETSGGNISGSSSVARYVARLSPSSSLLGANPLEAAQIDSWIENAARDFELPAAVLTLPTQGRADAPDTKVSGAANQDVRAFFGLVSKHLQTKTYLVGETVTLADIYLFSAMVEPMALVLDRKLRDTFVNVTRWFSTIASLPEVQAVTGGVTMCEEAAAAKKVEAKPKEEKPKAEPKPKAEKVEKPKEAPKPKPKDEEEEEPLDGDEAPKKKNPLDLLPKSKLDFDAWKRQYSNEPNYDVSMKWLWENYDPEGYSIYFCDYLYNNENKVLFMTSNAIRGFFQRLENMHKYAFGSMLMCNDKPPFDIVGCWMFRGNDIPAELRACDDYEYYKWTKADTSDEATRTKIGQMWSGIVPGVHVDEDWKVFK